MGLAVAGGILVWAAPGGATAYGPWSYAGWGGPYYPGWNADYCAQAQMVDTARASTYMKAFVSGQQCNGPIAQVPAGYMGSLADCYRNGSWVGWSGWRYNSGSAHGFQYYYSCENPSGTQAFHTGSDVRFWTQFIDGSYNYYDPGNFYTTSPAQNY